MAYGAEDIQEQNGRMEYLERLYKADMRDKPEHPFHGVFTGLYNLYKNHWVYGTSTNS